MGHPDTLSCLPLAKSGPDIAPAHKILCLKEMLETPLHTMDIVKHISKERVISHFLDWVWCRWPEGKSGLESSSFAMRREELSAHKRCLLWGSWIILLPTLRKKVMSVLHKGWSE